VDVTQPDEPIDLPVTPERFFADVESDMREAAAMLDDPTFSAQFKSMGLDPEYLKDRFIADAESAREMREELGDAGAGT